MSETLKIVIPMAGYGARLRPLTWSKPKPLVPLAGRTMLDYLLDSFKSVPASQNVEYVFILGNMGDQIKAYLQAKYPHLRSHFVIQTEMKGQSDALWLAREYMTGPVLITFTDTLVEADFSNIPTETSDAVVWVKPVDDPRRFGVAETDKSGYVKRLVEKPKSIENNLVMVGVYYIKQGEKLIQAIEEQVQRNLSLHGEFYLADAINVLLEKSFHLRAQPIETWLDAGTPATVLSTNRYFLEHGIDNSKSITGRRGTAIIPPVYIHPTANITASVIGPNVSIGADCQITSCILRDVIIEAGSQLTDTILENTILGCNVRVVGKAASMILGDQTQLDL